MADFDVIADATYTGILKPDRRAYLDCVAKLGLTVADCVFVDDQPANVAGARQVDLMTIWFNVREPAASFAQALQVLLKN